MQVKKSDQVEWVKVENIAVRVWSAVWVGEIQVRHNQFAREDGWVIELEHMQFSGRTWEVMVGNAVG